MKLMKVFTGKALKCKWRPFIWKPLAALMLLATAMALQKMASVFDPSKGTFEEPNLVLSQDDVNVLNPVGRNNKLCYAPKNNSTEEIIEAVRSKLQIMNDQVTAFATIGEMEQACFKKGFFAIDFSAFASKEHLRYTIRTKNNNFRSDEVYSRNLNRSFQKATNEYFDSGFLALQSAVEQSFIEIRSGGTGIALPRLYFERVPCPEGAGTHRASEIYNLYLILTVLLTGIGTYLLMTLLDEKSAGIHEQLRIVTSSSYWNEISFFLTSFGELILFVVLFMFITNVSKGSENLVLFCILLLLFVICLITFTFFLSAVTESLVLGPICYLAPLVLAYACTELEVILTMFPMVGLKVGASILHDYQNSWHSFQWKDAFSTGYPGNERISLAGTMLMLALGSLLWTFLWFYISNVRPGKFGTPKHWLFLLEREYYQTNIRCRASHDSRENLFNNDAMLNRENRQHPDYMVKISNLYKTYQTPFGSRTAVNNLSLEIPRNQITVLLGQNGAGKTTTMNIITGLTPQTSGRVEVDGEINPSSYRKHIGYCPQHNVLMSYLTVREHLVFFARLRGMACPKAKEQADKILENFKLLEKENEFPAKLSGGMKQRLCLANAIMGRTKLLILDEPTSGLDPESRKDIRNVLLELKKNHTILITSHFMEEVEELGDRIAILEKGELIDFGTPGFLKQRYGKGYTLKLLKGSGFVQTEVMAKIREYIETAVQKPAVESIFAVTMPYEEIKQYVPLLEDLEENKNQYGIDSISVTDATMEETFLNSLPKTDALEPEPANHVADTSDPSNHTEHQGIQSQVLFSQMKAIAFKKYIHIKRNLHIYGIMSALPIITTILCFLLSIEPSQTNFDAVSLHHSTVNGAFAVIVLNGKDRPVGYDSWKNSSYFRNLDLVVAENQTVENFLLAEAKKDEMRYFDRLVAAFEFNVTDRSLKVLHNNNLLHSSGIAVNLASNLLLHYYGYGEDEISVQNNSPRKKTLDDPANVFVVQIAVVFMVYIWQYLQLPYLETSSGFRRLQKFYPFVYWAGTFVIDFAVHILICLTIFVVSIIFDCEQIFSITEHGQILTLLILYGMPALVVVYIVSQCANRTAVVVTFSGLTIFGLCGMFLLADGYREFKESTGWIFLFHLVPQLGLMHSLSTVFENQKSRLIQVVSKGEAGDQLELSYGMPLLVFIVLFFVLNKFRRETVVNCLKNVAEVVKQFCCCCCKTTKKSANPHSSPYIEMNNVSLDRNVEGGKIIIDVQKLTKKYNGQQVVQGISFQVKPSECFVIVGQNGAGKTSTFQMITQNLSITDGNVLLNKRSMQQQKAFKYKNQLGYCPQEDTLLDFMTAHELINYCAMMKNLPNSETLTDKCLTQFGISEYANTRISDCSGGTKRMINTILAMLGNPSIVILDEPTTGVDPKSKRLIWNRIRALQQGGTAVMLSSHSMDECEELCNDLRVMDNGTLQCIGPIKLRKDYGNGFNLVLKLNEKDDHMSNEITDLLKCQLKETHDTTLKFFVPDSAPMSDVFSKITDFKENNSKLESFSINEISLEDCYLKRRSAHQQSGNNPESS